MAKKISLAADDDMNKANQTAVDEVKKTLAGAVEEPVEMAVDPVEPDDDEVDPEPGQPGTRDQKRRDRGRQFKADREAAEARNRDLEQQLNQERAARAAAEQYARMQQTQRDPGKDPLDAEIEKIDKEMMSLSDLWNAKAQAQQLSTEEAQELRQRYIGLQRAGNLAAMKKAQGPQQPAQDPGEAATRQMLFMSYPDVMNHPNQAVFAYAEAHVRAERVATGRNGQWGPLTKELMDEGMNAARKRFGLASPNGHAPPSEATKRKFVGGPSGPKAGDEAPRTIKMDATRMRIAEARYPQLAAKDPKLAHKKWAETAGKKMLENGDA